MESCDPEQLPNAAHVRTAEELLRTIADEFSPVVLASSLGVEDMVLTDMIARANLPIEIFSLDTGRLHPETYDLLALTARRYGIRIKLYNPRHEALEAYAHDFGINGFYESVAARKQCCAIRKVEPLARALKGAHAWITGMRATQSPNRSSLPLREWDAEHGLTKFNPLSQWREPEVWAYVRAHEVPYNVLHDRHFPSIGCAPCTRAIAVGEDIRAGRWWWESEENKECGLHPVRIERKSA